MRGLEMAMKRAISKRSAFAMLVTAGTVLAAACGMASAAEAYQSPGNLIIRFNDWNSGNGMLFTPVADDSYNCCPDIDLC